MSETIAVNVAGITVLLRHDGSAELLRLPTLRDCTIDELFQILKRLPEDVCLSVDRETGHIRILRRPHGFGLDRVEISDAELPLSASCDHLGCEDAQAAGNHAKPDDLGGEVGDLFLIVRHLGPRR